MIRHQHAPTGRLRPRTPNLAAVLSAVMAAALLPGCAVVTVAGAAAGAAISVTGAVVSTGVQVAGKVIGKAVDVVTPGN